MLHPREQCRPQMPSQLSPIIEQQIVAFALGHTRTPPYRDPLGTVRMGPSDRLAQRRLQDSCRHGPNTWTKRLALVAGYIDTTRPGELVGIDCFFVGRLHGTDGPVWQNTACDTTAPLPGPIGSFAHQPVRPSARTGPPHRQELQAASRQLERVLTDNGNEFGGGAARRPGSGRPQTNCTTLEECWRPAFARFSKSVSPA
jgi:hypothetical protein